MLFWACVCVCESVFVHEIVYVCACVLVFIVSLARLGQGSLASELKIRLARETTRKHAQKN